MSIPKAPTSLDRIPIDLLPRIRDSKDPKAAADAYLSVRTLFDHRVKEFGDKPFVGEILHIEDEAKAQGKTYTFSEVSALVDKALLWLDVLIPHRRKGVEPIVVGTLGRNGLAYVVWDLALTKL